MAENGDRDTGYGKNLIQQSWIIFYTPLKECSVQYRVEG